ncbi:hypothetical protein CARUB_v10021270mg [Capsella rubella]|uniref:RING-type E3 ubiquitin transferase n=1 Tax=Capsella rubella TaxID=81985 RepID=R0HVB2_9BRAS|nr:E3 ubiquitin-protein ligase SINA-like 2 [Capsella rubella]EOA33794.1 hypothetical protein CARUB_v10021270mg [Capsella rubella]
MENPGRTTSGDDMSARTGMLSDLDLLECPICCNQLASPIFQCMNGHIICSGCKIKVKNKCPSCSKFIGNNRSRITERLLEAVFFPCRNAGYGCTKKLSYGKELVDHEKECNDTVCYCPEPYCPFAGFDKSLYHHFNVCHKDCTYASRLRSGQHVDVYVQVNINQAMIVLQEDHHGPLVILQSFRKADGLAVIVNLLAPSAPGDVKLGCNLFYRRGQVKFMYDSDEMNRIQKVSFEAPRSNYLSIPYEVLDESFVFMKMEIRIRESRYEEEEDDEDEDEYEDEDEDEDEDEYAEE